MLKFVRVSEEQAVVLLQRYPFRMRKADRDECVASTGEADPWTALMGSFKYSSEFIEVCLDTETEEIVSIFGLGSCNGIGIPWMVGSRRMLDFKKVMMAYSRRVVASMLNSFPLLANYVDSRNKVHIRWLAHMGFKFKEGVGSFINGVWFDYFYMER